MTKIEYLQNINKNRKTIKSLKATIKNMRENMDGIRGIDYTKDRVLSGYSSDTSFIIILQRIEQYEKKLHCAIRRLTEEIDTATTAILDIESGDEKNVLILRYLNGMEFWEIAAELNYSERQIFRLHKSALDHLALPGCG